LKQLSAILLIALFLFTQFGYSFVFDYAQQQSDVALEVSLDKDEYNEADLLTIKVPLSLPYVNSQANFERVNGEIEVDGKIYKYVKRKIADGQLVLLCIPDYNKMKLQNAKEEFYKYANDLVQNNNSKKSDHSKSVTFKKVLSDFYTNENAYSTRANGMSQTTYNHLARVTHLPTQPQTSPEQPPEILKP
jgi:hypothetical protein